MNQNTKDSAFQLKSLEEDGIFFGYASVFDCVDFQNEQVVPGAFSASLDAWRAKGSLPKFLWQHDHRHPLGMWHDMQENATGLLVKGQLFLDLQKGREAYILLKRNVINSLSIGYSLNRSSVSPKGHRLLQEIDLHEVSLVTYAANPKAKVEWVKQEEKLLDT